jgi:hypothetical protein
MKIKMKFKNTFGCRERLNDKYITHKRRTGVLKEIAKDEDGKLLWEKPYPFRRLFAEEQTQVVDNVTYKVISCRLNKKVVITILKKEDDNVRRNH